MIKIGFIDYYLDEWHANNYPDMLKKESDGEQIVCYAYGKIDNPKGMTNKEWAEKYSIELLDSIEEVVEKSDRIIVLSPDNPEMHEELSQIPLESGKLVYIDKTFAPDKATAVRIFEHADKNNTKCYSSSSLRFSSELELIDKKTIHSIHCEGSGDYDVYSVHLIEQIVCLMECRARDVMFTGSSDHPTMIIRFEDGRNAYMQLAKDLDFRLLIDDVNNNGKAYKIESDFISLFIKKLVKYFRDGIVPVEHSQTIDVIAIREAGFKAMKRPFEWVRV